MFSIAYWLCFAKNEGNGDILLDSIMVILYQGMALQAAEKVSWRAPEGVPILNGDHIFATPLFSYTLRVCLEGQARSYPFQEILQPGVVEQRVRHRGGLRPARPAASPLP